MLWLLGWRGRELLYTIIVAMFNYEISEGDNYALTIQDHGEILLRRYQKVSEETPGLCDRWKLCSQSKKGIYNLALMGTSKDSDNHSLRNQYFVTGILAEFLSALAPNCELF